MQDNWTSYLFYLKMEAKHGIYHYCTVLCENFCGAACWLCVEKTSLFLPSLWRNTLVRKTLGRLTFAHWVSMAKSIPSDWQTMDNKLCKLRVEGKNETSPTRSIQEPLWPDNRLMSGKMRVRTGKSWQHGTFNSAFKKKMASHGCPGNISSKFVKLSKQKNLLSWLFFEWSHRFIKPNNQNIQ